MILSGNNVPQLQELDAPNIPIDPKLSWLRDIRYLFRSPCLGFLYRPKTCLKYLALDMDIHAEAFSITEHLFLPHLRETSILHRPKACLSVIEHVVPANECRLVIRSRYNDPPFTTFALKRYSRIFSDFSQANHTLLEITYKKFQYLPR